MNTTMKRIVALVALSLCMCVGAKAQEMKFVDASQFPLYGKAVPNTMSRYERFPESMASSRDALVYLSRHSAGLYIRFRTDSDVIGARWTSLYKELMNHMAPTGTRGLDLYVLENGRWRNLAAARPNLNDATTQTVIIPNMKDAGMREYMLYLSLYDGVTSLEIGVSPDAFIGGPEVDSPRAGNPIVMYGTSVLQGGCCSRPGMVHTSIISRAMDKEVVNLGFSGNALLDLDVAELMASVENPALFVLDFVPNASFEMIQEKGEAFFRILRDAHPSVPIIFVEDPKFATYGQDNRVTFEVDRKNAAQKHLVEKLKAAGEARISYVTNEELTGNDFECFVDGIHLTDLGMMRYAEVVLPYIKAALK